MSTTVSTFAGLYSSDSAASRIKADTAICTSGCGGKLGKSVKNVSGIGQY